MFVALGGRCEEATQGIHDNEAKEQGHTSRYLASSAKCLDLVVVHRFKRLTMFKSNDRDHTSAARQLLGRWMLDVGQ